MSGPLIDPHDLDLIAAVPRGDRHRGIPLAVKKRLEAMTRAVQVLPRREIFTLYCLFVNGVNQADVSQLIGSAQGNVSYRLDRAFDRIRLRCEIAETCSETTLRSALVSIEAREDEILVAAGMYKMASPALVAKAVGHQRQRCRAVWIALQKKLARCPDPSPDILAAIAVCDLISRNVGHLWPPDMNSRFKRQLDVFPD